MSLQALAVASLLALGHVSHVSADFRCASQPTNNYQVRNQGNVNFAAKTCLYIEPSAFGYAGLAEQRKNAYDNFLRSNIDNEQDKRDFNKEVGRDMLPFRAFEAFEDSSSNTVQTKLPANNPAVTLTPGVPFSYPFRWNNPHASELEVNIWISDLKYVVPVLKPTCSGEGHQDNVITFVVPTDFNEIGSVVPLWNGCKKVGDCVLQVYAHSVESRMYAFGVPVIVDGTVPAPTATDTSKIQIAGADTGIDLSILDHDLCLSAIDPSARIAKAVPRFARLISDQYNHAYQNSDYSPYSGQQPEAISRNLQASCILSMVTGNRGELGKALLAQDKTAAALQAKLETKVKDLVKKYEGVTNKIINTLNLKNTGTEPAASNTNGATQALANCFRCAEVGSVTTTRQETNTYVPSFQIPADKLTQARNLVPQEYKGLIDANGKLKIYEAVLNDMKGEFAKAATLGLNYQPAALKNTTTTMLDKTNFIKKNAAGKTDNGLYAAQQARAAAVAAQSIWIIAPAQFATPTAEEQTPIMAKLDTLSTDTGDVVLPDTGATDTELMFDMSGLYTDSSCDDDSKYVAGMVCTQPQQLFAGNNNGTVVLPTSPTGSASSSSVLSSFTIIAFSVLAKLFY